VSESQELLSRLSRIEELLTTIAKVQFKDVFERELANPTTAKLYEFTGAHTSRELAKRLNCSRTQISETWQRWERLGLLVKEGKSYRKVF